MDAETNATMKSSLNATLFDEKQPMEASTIMILFVMVSAAQSNSSKLYFQSAVLLNGLIGTFANGFVLFVLVWSKQIKKHVMNYLVLSDIMKKSNCMAKTYYSLWLAIASVDNYLVLNQLALDLFSSVVLVITYSFNLRNLYLSGPSGYWLCLILVSELLLFIGLNGSMINLAFVSIERYVKIVHAIWHKKYFRPCIAYAAVLFSWLTGFTSNVVFTPLTTKIVDGQCVSAAFWESQTAQRAFGIWYFCTFFGVPVISFIYCYGCILRVVIRRRKRTATGNPGGQHQANSTTPGSDPQNERLHLNAVKTTIILTSCFVVSWLPNHVYYLLMNLYSDMNLLNDGWYVTLYFGFFNISANPFIYAMKLNLVKTHIRGFCGRRLDGSSTG